MDCDIDNARRFILDSIPDMAWFKDLNSRFVAVNEAFAKFSGHEQSELVGQCDRDIWPDLAPKYESDDQAVIRSGMRSQLEEAVISKDGRRLWLETIKTPFRNQEGVIIGTVGISRDITQRKQTEDSLRQVTQEFQIIFDSIPATVWFKDTQNRFLRVNKATAELLGCDRSQIEGKSAYEVFPQAEAEKYFRDDVEVITSGRGKYGIVEEVHSSTGEVKTVRTDKIPYIDAEGTVTGLIAVANDITDVKKSEKERELLLASEKQARAEAVAAQASAEKALAIKSRFLDIAAHELKTPVTAFSLMLQFADKQLKSGQPVDRALFERIERQANRLSRLVVDLLDVSRLERGVLTLNRVRVDIVELVSSTVEDFRISTPLRQIVLNVPLQPIEISLDPVRINQVISNFLDNAIKYTPDNTLIEVAVEPLPSRVRVSVKDHGAGIPSELQTQLFKAFARGRTDRELQTSGLGLGLFVCHGIIELHGGKIGVMSEAGVGSTFYFDLPEAGQYGA